MSYVYLFQLDDLHKIGRSKDPVRRLPIVRGRAAVARIVHVIPTASSRMLEWTLHQRFASVHQGGELFRLTPDEVALICSVSRADSADELPPGLRSTGRTYRPSASKVIRPGYRQLVTQIPKTLLDALHALADSLGRSLTVELTHAMRRHLEAPPRLLVPALAEPEPVARKRPGQKRTPKHDNPVS